MKAAKHDRRTKKPPVSAGKPSMVQQRDKQVSFYCTEEFYKLIQGEKVRRGLTTQEMITTALTEYFQAPSFSPKESPNLAKAKAAIEALTHLRVQEIKAEFESHRKANYDFERWIDLCTKYFKQMPKAKLGLLEEYILLDLKHYASSRLKITE